MLDKWNQVWYNWECKDDGAEIAESWHGSDGRYETAKWSLMNSHHYIGNVRKANEISIKAGRSRAKDRDAK